ncbi:PTH1 family peptidyl-tRNA hydrolase [Sinobacterium caligoides]|uniref:Peptidyl-tRNA hydrolase n=1 Tax=Sinobacterium caligoides TaxID=933926 RepID=A0A3N2E0Y6_9GAMM|nr:PTH1 family peptidyl-tRNA hydrolase [Sinobacterium caligoides]
MSIKLIVGLGNPGADYEGTRHNAGAMLVEELARQYHGSLQPEAKFFGLACRISLEGRDVRLLIPTTFMNLSGKSIAALAQFYKIDAEEILVVHDELDIPPGTARFKQGGGHGGHNGLRDTISALGNNKNFHRLRLGIGHPGNAKLVSSFVLKKPSLAERQQLEDVIAEALRLMPLAINKDWGSAMNKLHSFKA